MPIRQSEKHKYPPRREWLRIRQAILARAGNRCEGTSQFPECRAVNRAAHPDTGSMVVLTIAHMDHDPTNNDPMNLRALCQRCHLTYDAKLHAKNARETRAKKSRQIELIQREQ